MVRIARVSKEGCDLTCLGDTGWVGLVTCAVANDCRWDLGLDDFGFRLRHGHHLVVTLTVICNEM